MIEVVELTPADTHPLRRTVLRTGTISDCVVFDGDDDPATFHLGVRRDGDLVAISTWVRRRYPDRPDLAGCQLRGMATDPAARGHGIGTLLLERGTARCVEGGAEAVWARARTTALDFYRRHGFETVGPEYVDLATGLPHRDILRLLATRT